MGKLLPRLMKMKFAQGYVMSFRWFNMFFDVLSSKEGYHFIQYGRRGKPARFICRVMKSAKKPPMFLFSHRWTIHYQRQNLMIGEGKKPIDMSKFWKGVRYGVC